MLNIKYSAKAYKQLLKISKGSKKAVEMIVKVIEKFAGNPSANLDVKTLKGQFDVFKRIRVGNYRIIFDNDNKVMLIYEIKHRQEAYND